MKYPDEMEDCSFIRILENTIVETATQDSAHKHLEDHGEVSVKDLEVCSLERKNEKEVFRYEDVFESSDLDQRKAPPIKPSLIEAPTLDFKPLPAHLKYVYL
ncbi:MAG: hypothetical protein Q8835_03675, partial [Sweet potato little leaf phytoplasma]|nr:hypothetical protein [Sweet potato little leaf phytoplasma]